MIKGWHVKYDPIRNRVLRTYNGVKTRYVVDPSSVLLAETDDQGNITAYYVQGLGLISKITPQGEDYYYHYDALGSTVAMTDAAGAVVNKYAYGIFGQVIDEEEQVENPFKYVGAFGVMDEGNGLFYMRARYYDPETGRFISRDPIGLAGGINVYAYVGNNPINYVDPLGLFEQFADYAPDLAWDAAVDPNGHLVLTGVTPIVYQSNPNEVFIKPLLDTYQHNMDKVAECSETIQDALPEEIRPTGAPYPGFWGTAWKRLLPLRKLLGLP